MEGNSLELARLESTRRSRRGFAVGSMLVILFAAISADGANFVVERIASGLARPVYLVAVAGDTDRVFIVEQRDGTVGRVRVLELAGPTVLAQPFLSIDPVSTGFEQGVLGLAFHPDYSQNGYFYVSYTDTSDTLRIVRYEVSADPNVADAATASAVLSIAQPQGNHNGGWMDFGPDGYLYVSSGDGGGANDNETGHTPATGNAQDITDNLLGKILRIDVDGDDFPGDATRNYAIPAGNPFALVAGDDEIWAYGLRNPWRPSFDRATGDLYIADVGQDAREEVNVQPAGSGGGENYGWRLREGTIATPTGGVGGSLPAGAIEPIYDYEHGTGAFEGGSVTGGYVYRGPVWSLRGLYFFGDFINDRIWSLRWDGSDPSGFDGTNFDSLVERTGDPSFLPATGTFEAFSSFGEDAMGNLYILGLDGDVFRLTSLLEVPALAGWAQAVACVAIAAGGARVRRRLGTEGEDRWRSSSSRWVSTRT